MMSFILGVGFFLVSAQAPNCAAALNAIHAIQERSEVNLDQNYRDPGNLEAGSYRDFASDFERKAFVARLERLKKDLASDRARVQILTPNDLDRYRSDASNFELFATALWKHYREHRVSGFMLVIGASAGVIAILSTIDTVSRLRNNFGFPGFALGTILYVVSGAAPALAFEHMTQQENFSKFTKQGRLQRRLENWWTRGKDYSGNWLILSRRSLSKDIDYLFYFDRETTDPKPILLRIERDRSLPIWLSPLKKVKPILTYPVSESLTQIVQSGAERVGRLTSSQRARVVRALSSLIQLERQTTLGDVLKDFPTEKKQALILLKRGKNTFWLVRPKPYHSIERSSSILGQWMTVIEFERNSWNEKADSDFNVRFVKDAYHYLPRDSLASMAELPTSDSPESTVTWEDIEKMAEQGRNLKGFDPEALSPTHH